MVSFWPFKGDSTSAASFEKTLSQLSTKINKASAQNERLRNGKRQIKALLTLWGGFAYIIVALILVLVIGWDAWGPLEYSAVAGTPIVIYGARTALDAYYNYRIANAQTYLNSLNAQRDSTIEKLKAATKYNSTQQLLDKYGGGSPPARRPSPQPGKKSKTDHRPNTVQGVSQGRTGFAPPPTANIQGKAPPPPGPIKAEGGPSATALRPETSNLPGPPMPSVEPTEEFAPNAFTTPPRPTMPRAAMAPQYSGGEGPQWYDRIMDVILGEDETSAKNRVALICQNCRLVNGQAPPGARTAEDIGRWRCGACHAWNGVESEAKKILNQITKEGASPDPVAASGTGDVAPGAPLEDEGDEFEHVEDE